MRSVYYAVATVTRSRRAAREHALNLTLLYNREKYQLDYSIPSLIISRLGHFGTCVSDERLGYNMMVYDDKLLSGAWQQ